MKLTGNLKKQVEKAESKGEEIRKADFSELSAQSRTGSPLPSVGGSDEKKSLIENAGMLLNDDELEMVSGGAEEGNIQTQYIEFRDGLDGREQRDGDDNDGGGNGGGGNGGGIGTVQWITN